MANLVLRLVKGSPVTDEEMDTNLTNLNKDSYLSVRNSTPWVASTAFAKGEILNVDTRFYLVTIGGTTSGTAPTHTSGTATNGTAQLQFGGISYYSAKDVLDKVKSLAGSGSGLDADTVRALTPSATVPVGVDKTSIVSRDISGNSSYNNITAAGVGSQTLTITGATNLNTLAIASTFSVRGSPGSDGQFLISRGSSAQPEWVDVNLNPNVVNENTNAVRYITFVDSTGNQQIKIDSSTSPLTYNPSSNNLSANITGNVTGNLTGNVTGNVTGASSTAVNLSGGVVTTDAGELRNTGNSVLGSSTANITEIKSMIAVSGQTGSAGQVLTSNGTGQYPTWTTPQNTLANNHIWFNGAVYSTTLVVPAGTWVIYAWWRYHHITFVASQLYIDGVMVDSLPNRGDPEGQNHFNLCGATVISGGRTITVTGGGGTTADLRLLIQGFRIG